MSVAAAFCTSMVRVTSVPDSVLAGAVKVTVPLALPPLPASMLMVLGEVEEKLWSLLTCTVNVPVASEDTVKGTEMVAPGSMLILLAWAWKSRGREKVKERDKVKHFFMYFM